MPVRCLVLLVPLLLFGCSLGHRPDVDRLPAATAERQKTGVTVPLIPLAPPFGPPRRILQKLTAEWSNHRETMLCVLELDDTSIAMSGLTAEGLTLFDLVYDGKTLHAETTPLLPEAIAPERVIADLQLVYWPLNRLNRVLYGRWRLEAESRQRRLFFGNALVAEIHYRSHETLWPKSVELINRSFHYRLAIETLSYETLPE